MAKVITASKLVHKATGKAISPFSALPYGDPADWERVTTGYTIQWDDGTVGCGRPPFATAAEAQAIIDKNPNFPGMNQG